MKKKLIVANWKMNGDFDQSNEWLTSFFEKLDNENLQNVEAIVCPPALLIDSMSVSLMDYGFVEVEKVMKEQNKKVEDFSEDELTQLMFGKKVVSLGAQDCHYEESGAFTGDISARMLAEIGTEYVILGHSERRAYHFESDEIVAKKIKSLSSQDLIAILCVGENKETRDSGKHLEFVYKQLMNSVAKDVKFTKFIIAYEPIWSIGTGVVPSIAQIKEMTSLIKKVTQEKLTEIADEFFVLYGGSVALENSDEILSISNLDGLLIGKASLNVDDFFAICKKASS